MSDDTLMNLIAEHIGRNIRPIIKLAWAAVLILVGGTATVVGMWHDLKDGTASAQNDATRAIQKTEQHVEPMLNNHETRIAVMEARRTK